MHKSWFTVHILFFTYVQKAERTILISWMILVKLKLLAWHSMDAKHPKKFVLQNKFCSGLKKRWGGEISIRGIIKSKKSHPKNCKFQKSRKRFCKIQIRLLLTMQYLPVIQIAILQFKVHIYRIATSTSSKVHFRDFNRRYLKKCYVEHAFF